ncbi:hypothetical protein SAMN04487996_10424 [Dyadobacter soli]|uniref:Uncharacterized protein n=1 Tax=Dyadobacter soli TaxID=659014 RepID=A0A1G7AZI7_9BACT|nr:hypothetical protein [Dyadobacter soli]SDE20203.1 hypothetical protein SAMN04487996_10424 [Dyadobacter soli]
MKLITNIFLFLYSAISCIAFAPFGLVMTIVDAIRFPQPGRVRDSFLTGARALDVYANETYYSLFNGLFLSAGGYHFGRKGETLSSALGKNWTLARLTWLGLGCAGFLGVLDGDHCYKSIEGEWHIDRPAAPISWINISVFALLAVAGLLLSFKIIILMAAVITWLAG